MPYIKSEDRPSINMYLAGLASILGNRPGNLNYAITKLVHDYVKVAMNADGELRYAMLNAIMGVLECAKLEVYRKVVAPYEDEKCKVNGPVSELEGK